MCKFQRLTLSLVSVVCWVSLVTPFAFVACSNKKPATSVAPGDNGETTIRYIKLGGIALEAVVDEGISFEQGMSDAEVDPEFKKDLHDLLAQAKTGLREFNARARNYTRFDATAKGDVSKLAGDVVGFLEKLNDAGLLKIKNPEKQKRARQILTGAKLVARGFQVFSEASAVP